MFISNAYASANGASAGGFFSGLFPLILIFLVFYLLIIRPQQKQIRQHKEMVEKLKKGNKVRTSGGVVGVISKVNSETVEIVSLEETKIEVAKESIVLVLSEKAKKTGKGKAKSSKVKTTKDKKLEK